MSRRWQRRGARSTGNLSSMSFATRLAALRALVAAKLRREPKRDGAQRGGADRVSAALVVYSLTRRCRVLGTNRKCEGGNLAALPGVVDEARGIRPLPALRGSSAYSAALPVCSTSRRCAWRNIRLSSGGIGARSVRTYRNDLVWLSGNADVEVLQPRSFAHASHSQTWGLALTGARENSESVAGTDLVGGRVVLIAQNFAWAPLLRKTRQNRARANGVYKRRLPISIASLI